MGMEHLIAGCLASMIVNGAEQRAKERHSSAPERQFVSARNKVIVANYTPIQMSWFDEPTVYHYPLPLFSLTGMQRMELSRHYKNVIREPRVIGHRTVLITYLLRLWKDCENILIVETVQNELLYIIDHFVPMDKQGVMYQHLAMFISSECYFFKGDLTNTLKRLYQVVDWREIYTNVEEQDRCNFNELENFHEAAIVNIVNLYALVGLPNHADRMRDSCRAFTSGLFDFYHERNREMRGDTRTGYVLLREYYQNCINALKARDKMCAYNVIDVSSYKHDMFKESVAYFVRGEPVYSIQTQLVTEEMISYKTVYGLYNKKYAPYPSLSLQLQGDILNYQDVINRCRDEMSKI